jgi:OmpA-OmpF porin, OOP family
MKYLIFVFIIGFQGLALGQNQALYYFDKGLSEFTDHYPALQIHGSKGVFVEEVVEKFGKEKRKVYLVPANSGLMFDNSKIKNFINGSYGIEMYFRYDNGSLLLYNQLLGNDVEAKQGKYVHLVTTRDSKTQRVNVFVDGKLNFTFVDTQNDMQIDQKSQVDFFYEKGRETTSGAVAMIKLHDFFVDERMAVELFNVFSEGQKKENLGISGALKNLYFVQSLPKILPESLPELENLYDFLMKFPEKKIEIHGHTDNQGDFELNLKLSKDRAAAVKQFMVDKGISGKRIQTKGFGSTRPMASNAVEETRRKNRRVEMLLVE